MVKIKEGYVMTATEKAEYERVNALPRKTAGTVAYYYKRQTKYPPRIYVFMHAEIWQDRNRRPMGLHAADPFLQRPMHREEIEYHHFDTRQAYHQYESWQRLLYAEEQEAALLEIEQPGAGKAFFSRLQSFRAQLPLDGSPSRPSGQPGIHEDDTSALLREILGEAGHYNAAQVGEMLAAEQQGKKRTAVLILLRELYRRLAGEPATIALTPENIVHKAGLSERRTRRNFVRRVYAARPLFALAEIRERYPGYSETDLTADLKRRKPKAKRKKCKPIVDHRRYQLQKIVKALETAKLAGDETQYHHWCHRIAILSEAHRNRLPIPLLVKLDNQSIAYYFRWQTREPVIKAFAAKANEPGMTHERLKTIHQEMAGSRYSI